MTTPRLTTGQLLMELAREVLATILVLALVVPALVIHFVAAVSSLIIRWRGGVD